jgi:hypothetical protein
MTAHLRTGSPLEPGTAGSQPGVATNEPPLIQMSYHYSLFLCFHFYGIAVPKFGPGPANRVFVYSRIDLCFFGVPPGFGPGTASHHSGVLTTRQCLTPILLKAASVVMKGFSKATSSHMCGFLKAAEVDNFNGFFKYCLKQLSKPIHKACGGF